MVLTLQSAGILVEDLFDGVAADLHARTPVPTSSGAWTEAVAGQLRTNGSGSILAIAGATPRWAWCEGKLANLLLQSTVNRGGATTGLGLLARVASATDFWLADFSSSGVKIYERTADIETERAAVGITGDDANADWDLEFLVTGNVLTARIKNEYTSYTSAVGAARTLHGIKAYAGGHLHRNFVARRLR